MKSVIELAKEACAPNQTFNSDPEWVKRFAAIVQADLMKQVMDTCEAEYKKYDQLVVEEDTGHEEATAIIHLMRKLDRLRPATGKAERLGLPIDSHDFETIGNAYIAAFKEKNK